MSEKIYIIPPKRTRYLSEISENNRAYDTWAEKEAETADKLYALAQTIALVGGPDKLKGESAGKDADELIKPRRPFRSD